MITNYWMLTGAVLYVAAGISYLINGSPKLGFIMFFYALASFVLATMR